MKNCASCHKPKNLEEFYKQNDRPNGMSWCKACINENAGKRQRANKQRAVDLLGGKCVRCGYSKCLAALEFHHTDPDQKSSDFHGLHGRTWAKVLKEISKCILLCANCHREEEDKIRHEFRPVPRKDRGLIS